MTKTPEGIQSNRRIATREAAPVHCWPTIRHPSSSSRSAMPWRRSVMMMYSAGGSAAAFRVSGILGMLAKVCQQLGLVGPDSLTVFIGQLRSRLVAADGSTFAGYPAPGAGAGG